MDDVAATLAQARDWRALVNEAERELVEGVARGEAVDLTQAGDGQGAGPRRPRVRYRTPREWRISVGTPVELACGALRETPVTGSFETAVREFEAPLKREWSVTGPLTWEEFKPGWWASIWCPERFERRKSGQTEAL